MDHSTKAPSTTSSPAETAAACQSNAIFNGSPKTTLDNLVDPTTGHTGASLGLCLWYTSIAVVDNGHSRRCCRTHKHNCQHALFEFGTTVTIE
jgi:hypothetical protein